MFNDEPYRGCPICRAKLSRLLDYKDNGRVWKMYECPNCGSEISVDPFKKIRARYGK